LTAALRIEATAIGGGIAIARAQILHAGSADWPRFHIEAGDCAHQVLRLKQALKQVHKELSSLAQQLPADAPPEARALLDVHAMMLEDVTLCEGAYERIEKDFLNAEWALGAQASDLAEQFEALEDAYLRERARDVRQVAQRVLRALVAQSKGQTSLLPVARSGSDDDPFVVVAEDLAPADMLHLRHASAFVVGLGGVNSHTAILARSLNRPAVVGVGHAIEEIQDDDWLIVDGDSGVIIVNPDEATLAQYRRRQTKDHKKRKALRSLIGVDAVTTDGVTIDMLCNIELPEEAQQAMDVGASGVGLFRSEFLFLNREALPDEQEQFEAYRDALVAMQGRPVTIRTLDVGADKALPGQHRNPNTGQEAANPSLGQRAIRYCLAQPVLFLTQLRALLRASAFGPLRILLPMVAHPHEVTATREYLALARSQLAQAGHAMAENVELGAMIEVPAAAIAADWFARELDFLSIGTNDLVQYTLAIDRDDPSVAALYDPWHPAVLQLIDQTLAAGRRHGKTVTLCGEMAGHTDFTEVLLGMGLTSFSVNASALLRIKEKLMQLDTTKAHTVAQRAMGKMLA
jgi:phosphoenolpyruvate-protein phosphotransferase (PTS system enzyme I)